MYIPISLKYFLQIKIFIYNFAVADRHAEAPVRGKAEWDVTETKYRLRIKYIKSVYLR